MQNKSDRTSFGTLEVRVGLLKLSKSPKQSPKSPTTFSDFDGLRRIPTDSNRTSDGVRRVRSESVRPFLDIFEEKSPADSDGSPMRSKKRPSESDGLNWTRFGHPTESVGLLFTSDTCHTLTQLESAVNACVRTINNTDSRRLLHGNCNEQSFLLWKEQSSALFNSNVLGRSTLNCNPTGYQILSTNPLPNTDWKWN